MRSCTGVVQDLGGHGGAMTITGLVTALVVGALGRLILPDRGVRR
jgi:hypothetical protein